MVDYDGVITVTEGFVLPELSVHGLVDVEKILGRISKQVQHDLPRECRSCTASTEVQRLYRPPHEDPALFSGFFRSCSIRRWKEEGQAQHAESLDVSIDDVYD